jgi:predicted secreted protein
LRDWSVSTDGLVSYDGTNNIGDLYTLLSGRTSVSLKFTTNVTGDLVFSGTASVASISVSAEMEAAVTYSVEFTGKGPLTKATVTAPST